MNAFDETARRKFGALGVFVRSYGIGTVVGAIVLQFVTAMISPGEIGTVRALAYPTFLIFIPLIGLFALGPFMASTLIGFRFRSHALTNPAGYLLSSSVFGAVVGLLTTELFGLRILPVGHLGGASIGACFGLTWFFVLKSFLRDHPDA